MPYKKKYKKRKYGRRKRKRRRRGARGMRSVARQVVKQEMRKNVEMKVAYSTIGATVIPDTGVWINLIPTIGQGIGSHQRIGDRLMFHRVQVRAHMRGQGPTQKQEDCHIWTHLIYSKNQTPTTSNWATFSRAFYEWEDMATIDKPMVLARKHMRLGNNLTVGIGTPTTAAWTLTREPQRAKTDVWWTMNKKLKMRKNFDAATQLGPTVGLWLFSDIPAAGVDHPTIALDLKVFYTDA